MIRKFMCCALVLFAVSGCDSGMTTGQAEDKVRALLRDPSSAEFTSVVRRPPTKDSGAIVCGEVNARNGFGGMTGPKRFIAGSFAMIEDDSGDTARKVFDGLWQKNCV